MEKQMLSTENGSLDLKKIRDLIILISGGMENVIPEKKDENDKQHTKNS